MDESTIKYIAFFLTIVTTLVTLVLIPILYRVVRFWKKEALYWKDMFYIESDRVKNNKD